MVAAGSKPRSAPAKAKAAASPSMKKPAAPRASGSKPKAPAKGKGKPKLASAANTSIDAPSPTSTTSTPRPSPAKRLKANPNSSQTLLSSQELERDWAKDEEQGRSLGFDFNLVRPESVKKQKGKGKGKAVIPLIPKDYNADTTDEESELSEMEVEMERPRDSSPPARAASPPFQQTVLPTRLLNFASKPAILVKNLRNWFPGYLVDFIPVTKDDSASKKKRKADVFVAEGHPVTGWKGPKRLQRSHVMFLNEEKKIATCPLGDCHTTVQETRKSDAPMREASPEPPAEAPPLPSPSDFSALVRPDQLRLLRPHLSQIINETYSPAQKRINLFYKDYKGSMAKSGLSKSMLYGDIGENEVADVIVPELQRWLLRSCRPERADDVAQQGSERFNALSVPEKGNFIQYVLVPEIIIQLCIASTEEAELLTHYPAPKPTVSANEEEENFDAILSQASAVLQTLDGDKEAAAEREELNVEEEKLPSTNAEAGPSNPTTQAENIQASPAPSTPTPITNVPLPEPLPAAVSADPQPTPLMLYQSAKALLRDYADTSDWSVWSAIDFAIDRARTIARQAQNLPAENLSAADKERAKKEALLENGEYEEGVFHDGRLRKKNDYAALAGNASAKRARASGN